ncbi:MAG: recombinase family protein [Okeania sp. SIO3H1]|nr:recombinase family protein [Okeania sp. SIO3H1]
MRADIEALAKELADNDKQRVFGYCRISSTKQEQGLSIPAQEEAIRKYCRTQKLGEPFIVTETSSAGKRMFKLPSIGSSAPSDEEVEDAEEGLTRQRLMLLLGHVTALKNAHFVVWRLDRVARLGEEREVIHQLLLRSDVKMHSTDPTEQTWLEKGDPNDPMAALMRQIFGAFSQYEKAIIEMRMNTGMQFKASRGGYTGGRPPYGYCVKDRDLSVDAQQAHVVRYVFMLYKKYKLTLRGIDERLQGSLGTTKIHRIIKNEPMYRGRYRDRYGTVHERPDLTILTDNGDYNYEEEFYKNG